MFHGAEADHIFEQNKARTHHLDILEVYVNHTASRIIWATQPVHAEALARRATSDEVNLAAQVCKVLAVICKKILRIPRALFKPCWPTMFLGVFVKQIMTVGCKRIGMRFNAEQGREPGGT